MEGKKKKRGKKGEGEGGGTRRRGHREGMKREAEGRGGTSDPWAVINNSKE